MCDERPAPAYPSVEDPGALQDAGPLAAGVQRDLEVITGQACTRDNRVRLLVDGVQSYTAMLDLVESADEEILFENFIFSGDEVGRAFAAELRKRAEAGLDVRILHDPFGAFWGFHLPIGFRFHHSPAHVRVYNPPLPFRRFLRAGRDHRKLVVQDRRRAVAGGLCLADIWLGNCVTHCTWRDSAVLVEGSAARAVAEEFEQTWRLGVCFTPRRAGSAVVRSRRGSSGSHEETAGTVPVRVLADGSRERRVERVLVRVLDAAQSEILITNPYVVPTRAVERALLGVARRGIDIRILIPRFSNHHIVGLASEHVLGTLLQAGVRVWRWHGPMIHTKTVVIDRCWSLVGSTNLDALSLVRNAELNFEIHGTRVGEEMAEVFTLDCAGSSEFTAGEWRDRSRGRKLATRIAALGRAWQ